MLRIIRIKGTNAEKFYIKGGHALLICINDIPEILAYVEHINKENIQNIMQLYHSSKNHHQSVANMYYGLLQRRNFYVYCQIYPDLSIT